MRKVGWKPRPKANGRPRVRCKTIDCKLKAATAGFCLPCYRHRLEHKVGIGDWNERKRYAESLLKAWLHRCNLKPGEFPNAFSDLRNSFCAYLDEAEGAGLGATYSQTIRPMLWLEAFLDALPDIKTSGGKRMNALCYLNYAAVPGKAEPSYWAKGGKSGVPMDKAEAMKALEALEGPPNPSLRRIDRKP